LNAHYQLDGLAAAYAELREELDDAWQPLGPDTNL
jgi:hypothetical protein